MLDILSNNSGVRRLSGAAMPAPTPGDLRSRPALCRSPLLLLAAALIALAVFLVHDARPASAQEAPSSPPGAAPEGFYVWQGTLTVGDGGAWKGYSSGGPVGTLPDATFTFDGAEYEIERLSLTDDGATLQLVFDKAIPERLKSSLTLSAGPYHYRLAGATLADIGGTADDSATWADTRRSWSVGDEVGVTISSTYLWSATLTVGEILDGATLGCDDDETGSECSSNLTDNTFAYGGVDYQVETLTISGDFGGNLALIANKTLPDSLDNLVLHVDGRRWLLGDAERITFLVTNDVRTWVTGPAWSVGDTVQLRLTERQTPASRVGFRSPSHLAREIGEDGVRFVNSFCVEIDSPLESGGSRVHIRVKDDSTATEGDDYTIFLPNAPGTVDIKVLRLPHGATEACFGMTFRPDRLTEGDEVVYLELVAIAYAPYVVVDDGPSDFGEAEVTISDTSQPTPADADPGRGINVQPKSATVQTGSTVAYSISLNSKPDNDVTVSAYLDSPYSVSHNLGTAVSGMTVTPSSLTFTPTDWRSPQTFTLSPGDSPPGRYIVLHGLSSDDPDYNTYGSFQGPGIDGQTHIRITVTDGTSGQQVDGQGDGCDNCGAGGDEGVVAQGQSRNAELTRAQPQLQLEPRVEAARPATSAAVARYDADGDGSINVSEYTTARRDHAHGRLSDAQWEQILNAYLAWAYGA